MLVQNEESCCNGTEVQKALKEILKGGKSRSNSVADSGWSSVIADHLGFLVGQNRSGFLKMTEHN